MQRQILLCRIQSSNKYFYHNDYLGSAKAMTDNAGTKVYSWLGYPFGKQYSITGASYSNYRFTGKEYDVSTGLYYFGARYYMPEIGRFITPDPIVGVRTLNLKDPISLTLYSYAKDNPLRFIDPEGRQVFESQERLLEIGRKILKNPTLQPTTQTWCNKAVDLIAEMGGNLDYDNLTANQIIVILENKEYATEITDVNAAEYANKGAVVIAGAKEAVGSGHVAVVAPTPLGQLGMSGAWKITKTGSVPKVFNVGRSIVLDYANYGFSPNNPPKYYIRNIDKMKVDEMNKELRNE
ncbi:RHS repeat-associated core domain-containing protein [candidate division WOR-3 bacterium]|nr:RHS repeat-associated core domain-containing protein [candidate division WOR-3 bacterium]